MRLYRAAERLTAAIDRLAPRARRHAPGPADHLVRAAESVLFNSAEGLGCYRPRMKIAAFEIARKEAHEVKAVLRRLVVKGVFTTADVREAMDSVVRFGNTVTHRGRRGARQARSDDDA